MDNAPVHAAAIGATAFGLFLKNQRRWKAKPFADGVIERFSRNCERESFQPHAILPHDSYLINLGHPEPSALTRAREAFFDEMRRCEQLKLQLLNFHPGNHLNQCSVDDCIATIAESINMALDRTRGVTAVIENTAGQGSSVGFVFEHLAAIIEGVEDRERVGVCFDTCHAFAAGYDLRTSDAYEATFSEFDRIVGLEFLRAFHINDCKRELGSRVDRHASLGDGTLGMEPFRLIMSDPRFEEIPLILETPDSGRWPDEIAMLKSFMQNG